MRSYPKDKYDKKELKELNAPAWMVKLLKLNPAYPFWGPYEDYMWKDGEGWDSRQIKKNWKTDKFGLDDLNECVNFYFQIERDSKKCFTCNGTGYHPDARWVAESFYRHSSPFAQETDSERSAKNFLTQFSGESPDTSELRMPNFPDISILEKYNQEFQDFCLEMKKFGYWSNRVTQEDVIYLLKEGRGDSLWPDGKRYRWNKKNHSWHEILKNPNHNPELPYDAKTNPWYIVSSEPSFPELPKPEEVNQAQTPKVKPGYMGFDAIDRGILVRSKLKRFGIPEHCPDCKGSGHIFIEPEAHLNFVTWIIHPRKGCSRAVEYVRILEEDLPSIFEYLKEARKRNNNRFGKIK